MKLEISNKQDEKLLGRRHVTGRIVFDKATPSNEVVKKELAVQLSVDVSVVSIRGIKTIFGHTEAVFDAFVYNDAKTLAETEPGHSVPKGGRKKEAGKEAPKEAVKEAVKLAPKPEASA